MVFTSYNHYVYVTCFGYNVHNDKIDIVRVYHENLMWRKSNSSGCGSRIFQRGGGCFGRRKFVM